MAVGTVKWYNQKKGIGFIAGEGGRDVFVHDSAIEGVRNVLREGDVVEYELVQGEKGPKAEKVVFHKPETGEEVAVRGE